MPSQNIPLKGRTDSGDPAEFRPQRLFAFELRRWEAQLGPSARISAGCLRWQELPRFSADPFRLAGVRCIAALWRLKSLLGHRSDRPKCRLTTDQMAFVAGRHVALA